MKNRNKRITSVLAASMALGTFAPVIASVAPVFAYGQGSNVENLNDATYYSEDGTQEWSVTTNKTNSGYNAKLVSVTAGVTQTITSINIGSEVRLVNPNGTPSALSAKVTQIGDGTNPITTSSVTSVNISGSNIKVAAHAFKNLTNLETVSLTGVSEIGNYAFANDTELDTVTLGDGLTTIGTGAFQGTGLYTINIPDSVKTIDESAFMDSWLQGTIALPSSLQTIGSQSFDTKNDSLTLIYPQVNGENSSFPIAWATTGQLTVFGTNNWWSGGASGQGSANIKHFNIKGTGSLPTVGLGSNTWDCKLYLGVPTISLTLSNDNQVFKNPTGKVQVVLGQNVTIATPQLQTSPKQPTLEIDGKVVSTFTPNGVATYTYKTPQLGEHTITVTDGVGTSRTVTINVVKDEINYWLDQNFNIPEWHLGADVTPSGAVAKLGEVVYVYSKTENGVYYTNKPNSEGTWWVKAVVYGNNNQIDLSTAPQSFTVLAPLAKQGWENTAAGWTYYVDGEQVKSELITVDGRKYLIGDNGIMVKGWAKNDQTGNEWMFFDNYGCQKTGWLSNDGRWYFFNEDGVMQANEWVTDKGKSYFLTQSGGMAASRWLKKDGHDVYVDNSGALKTGWLFDSNYMAWYYLEPDTGYMATSGTVDGWTIQANGQAVQK